jgi:hypothetical protein
MERKCTKGQKEMRTHEKTRENHTKNAPKDDKNEMEKEKKRGAAAWEKKMRF